MSLVNYVKPITAVGINANTLGGAVYLPINAGGLTQSCNRVRIFNISNIPISISWDGANLNDYIAAGGNLDYQFLNTRDAGIYTPGIRKGQIFYALAAAPGVGFIYVSGYYQESI
jgi:hypothetical protein